MGATLKFTKSKWYEACRIYRELLDKKTSERHKPILCDQIDAQKNLMVYRSEKGSFGRYLKKYDTGTLKHVNVKRVKN